MSKKVWLDFGAGLGAKDPLTRPVTSPIGCYPSSMSTPLRLPHCACTNTDHDTSQTTRPPLTTQLRRTAFILSAPRPKLSIVKHLRSLRHIVQQSMHSLPSSFSKTNRHKTTTNSNPSRNLPVKSSPAPHPSTARPSSTLRTEHPTTHRSFRHLDPLPSSPEKKDGLGGVNLLLQNRLVDRSAKLKNQLPRRFFAIGNQVT